MNLENAQLESDVHVDAHICYCVCSNGFLLSSLYCYLLLSHTQPSYQKSNFLMTPLSLQQLVLIKDSKNPVGQKRQQMDSEGTEILCMGFFFFFSMRWGNDF